MANRPLVLTVDASVDPFRKAMKQGSVALAEFGKSADEIYRQMQDQWSKEIVNPDVIYKGMVSAQRNQMLAMRRSAEEAISLGKNFDPTGGMTSEGSFKAAAGYEAAAGAANLRAQAILKVLTAEEQAGVVDEMRTNQLRTMMSATLQSAQYFDKQSETLRSQAGAFAAVEAEMGGMAAASVATAGKVEGAHNRMSVSSMMMMHSVRSATDSFAAGLPPMMIFTEQMARMSEAAALAGPEGALGKFGAFMGGPWGIAVLAGVTILGHLAASLLDAGKDAETAKAEFLDVSGGMDAMATNADRAAKAMDRLRDSMAQPGATADAVDKITASKISAMGEKAKLDRQIKDAESSQNIMVDPDAAAGQALYLANLYRKRDAAQAAITKADSDIGDAQSLAQSAAMQEANRKRLDASPKKQKKGPADHSFEDANSFAQAIDKADEELARIKRDNVTDIEKLAEIDKRTVDAARAKEKDAIDGQAHQHHWTEIQRLSAQVAADELADAKKAAIDEKAARQLAERDRAIRETALQAQSQLLDIEMQLAATGDERRKLAWQMLSNERSKALIAIDGNQANGSITAEEAEAQRIELEKQIKLKGKVVDQANANPLQAFANGLNTRDTKTEVQQLVVDELTSVRNAIHSAVESITGTKDPIINGLISMLIEQVLLKPIADMLSKSMSGLGGGGIFSFLSKIPLFANGTNYAPGGLAIVGERGPELINLPGGSQVIPNHKLAYPAIPSASSLRVAPIVAPVFNLDMRGAVMTSDLLAQMNQLAVRAGAIALAAAPGLTQAELADNAMQRIPS